MTHDELKKDYIRLLNVIAGQKLEISLLKLQNSLIPHIKTFNSCSVYSDNAKIILFEYIIKNPTIKVSKILKFLNLSPTTYYNWLKYKIKTKRCPSLLKLTHAEKQTIIQCKKQYKKYGHKKIAGFARLNNDLWLSNSSSYNILKEVNMLIKKKIGDPILSKSKYEAYRPNLIWESDWSAIKINKILYQIIVIIDTYSRYILNWNIVKTVDSVEIGNVITKAYINQLLKYETLLPRLRFDNGPANISKYTQDIIEDLGIEFNPGRPYRPTDQSIIERWFRTLKQEFIYNIQLDSLENSFKLIGEWINYYNMNRPHESMFNYTPFQIHYMFRNKTESILLYSDRLRLGMYNRINSNRGRLRY